LCSLKLIVACPDNIDFAARELLDAPERDRPLILENIARYAACIV